MLPEVFTIEELSRLRKYYQSFSRIDPVRYIPRPLCKKLMQRKNWGIHSGIMWIPVMSMGHGMMQES